MHIFSLILITTLWDGDSDEEIDFREIQHHFTDEETETQKGAVLKSLGNHGGIGSHVSLAQTDCPRQKKKNKKKQKKNKKKTPYLSFSFCFSLPKILSLFQISNPFSLVLIKLLSKQERNFYK